MITQENRPVAAADGRAITVMIAGVHKAGTTSLFQYLAAHPGISPARVKELRYFTRVARDGAVPDLDEYDRLFRYREGARYRLEASPGYVGSRYPVARTIKSCLPDARIIVLLREPVERLLSLYNRAIAHSDLPAELSFHDYVVRSLEWRPGDDDSYVYTQGLREGVYIEHLRPWHALFGDHLKILFTDDLKADARAVTADVCRWLDLDPAALAAEPFDVSNRTLHYRHRRLHARVARWYMRSEAFWRRHPGIKRALRAVYNRINGARAERPAVAPETLELLRGVYAPANAALREFLVEQRVPLPAWLRSTDAASARRDPATYVDFASGAVRNVKT